MRFHFSRHRLKGSERFLERFFEIVPGALSWTILLGMAVLAFWQPLIAAVIIIAFDLYWLLKLFYMNIFLVLSYTRLSIEKETDWMARARGLDRLDEYLTELDSTDTKQDPGRRISRLFHKKHIRALKKRGITYPSLNDIYHVVIFPIARETREIIEPGIESIAENRFPPERILVVLAVEERAAEEVKRDARDIQKKYQGNFLDLLLVIHPTGLKGEARVKGANATYAARKAADYFEKKGIPFENIISSCFDADTVISPDYFGCLTYNYMVCPDRTQASFQPIPVYYNNIWEAPAFARVLDVGSSFFQLIEATNPEQLVTFSSHSMSFKALVDVGYWPVDMISDDSAIFWKALIHFDGHYRVIPINVTLSMDVTEAETFWKTVVNVYKQKRRWAWGAENIPIVIRAFLKSKAISFFRKCKLSFKLLEGHISWTTWPFLLTIVGWLPAILAGRRLTESIFYYSAPRITGIIFTLASVGLLICIVLSLLLLPKRKVKHNILRRIGHAFEWLLVPPIMVFLSAIPALDAQTRLMFARYMEFWVTIKKRG